MEDKAKATETTQPVQTARRERCINIPLSQMSNALNFASAHFAEADGLLRQLEAIETEIAHVVRRVIQWHNDSPARVQDIPPALQDAVRQTFDLAFMKLEAKLWQLGDGFCVIDLDAGKDEQIPY